MSNKLRVGNLGFQASSADLRRMFSTHGAVTDALVVADRETGRSRGFGFVQMETDEAAEAAIAAMDGLEQDGRTLTVGIAEAREGSGDDGDGYRRPRGARRRC